MQKRKDINFESSASNRMNGPKNINTSISRPASTNPIPTRARNSKGQKTFRLITELPADFHSKIVHLETEIQFGEIGMKKIEDLTTQYMRAVEYYEAYNNCEYKLFKHKLHQLYRNERVMDQLQQESNSKKTIESAKKKDSSQPKVIVRNERTNQNVARKIDLQQSSPNNTNKTSANEKLFSINPFELKIQNTPQRSNPNKKIDCAPAQQNSYNKIITSPVIDNLKKEVMKKDVMAALKIPMVSSEQNILKRRESKRQLENSIIKETEKIDIQSKKDIMIDKLGILQEKNAFTVKSSLMNQVDDIQRRIIERKQRANVRTLLNKTQALSDRSCIEFNSSFVGIDNARSILNDYKQEFNMKNYENILNESVCESNERRNSGLNSKEDLKALGFQPILANLNSPKKEALIQNINSDPVKPAQDKSRRPPLPSRKPSTKNTITESVVLENKVTEPEIIKCNVFNESPIKTLNIPPQSRATYFEDNGIKFATPENPLAVLLKKTTTGNSETKHDVADGNLQLHRMDSTNFKSKLDEMPSFMIENIDLHNTSNNNLALDVNNISGILTTQNDFKLTKKDNEQILMDLGSKVLNITEEEKEFSSDSQTNDKEDDQKNSNVNNLPKNGENSPKLIDLPKEFIQSPKSSNIHQSPNVCEIQGSMKKSRSFSEAQPEHRSPKAIIDTSDESIKNSSKKYNTVVTNIDDNINQIVEKIYITPLRDEIPLENKVSTEYQITEDNQENPIVKSFEAVDVSNLTPDVKKLPEIVNDIGFNSLNNTPQQQNEAKMQINIISADNNDEDPETPKLHEEIQEKTVSDDQNNMETLQNENSQNDVTLSDNKDINEKSQELDNESDEKPVIKKSARELFNEKQKEKTKKIFSSESNIFPVKSIETRDKKKKNTLCVNEDKIGNSTSPRSLTDKMKNDFDLGESKGQIVKGKRVPNRNK